MTDDTREHLRAATEQRDALAAQLDGLRKQPPTILCRDCLTESQTRPADPRNLAGYLVLFCPACALALGFVRA